MSRHLYHYRHRAKHLIAVGSAAACLMSSCAGAVYDSGVSAFILGLGLNPQTLNPRLKGSVPKP